MVDHHGQTLPWLQDQSFGRIILLNMLDFEQREHAVQNMLCNSGDHVALADVHKVLSEPLSWKDLQARVLTREARTVTDS